MQTNTDVKRKGIFCADRTQKYTERREEVVNKELGSFEGQLDEISVF